MAKPKVELYLAKVDDIEAQVQMVIDMGTQMSGRKPSKHVDLGTLRRAKTKKVVSAR